MQIDYSLRIASRRLNILVLFLALLLVSEEAAALRGNRRMREANQTAIADLDSMNETDNIFGSDEVTWSNINKEVDMVIPMVVEHLTKLDVQYLTLTDMNESIAITPLFMKYEVGIFLTNGIAYNIAGIRRHGDAFMTYKSKSFLTRFNLVIQHLQFEYDFLLKLTPIEGYGKVVGYLENLIIHAELAIDIVHLNFKLRDFRISGFSNIHVELDEMRLIRQLTGAILSPITNLFREHITSSISDSLRDQMQTLISDFNDDDPLELRSFTKKLIAGLVG